MVRNHPKFKSLPLDQRQLTDAWLKARLGYITASQVPKLLGFFEEKAAKVLGLSKIWGKPGSMATAWAQVTDRNVKTQEESVPMLWGKQHEPNMLALLLEDQQVMEVHECGFVSNTSTSLPIGASPDALLKTMQGATVAVECKAPCPFKENKGPGQESWTYMPGKAGYDYVPAAWYARCDDVSLPKGGMLALGVSA